MMTSANIVPLNVADTAMKNIVAVASGKGGVGKTWLTITLAHALSLAGRKVLLFDGDLGLANVDIQLGLMPRHDIGSVLAGQATMAEAVTRYADGNLDIIAGRSGSGSLATMPANKLRSLRDDVGILAANYDNLLLDLAAGVDESVRFLAASAATTLVVTTDEPTSITDAYALIKIMASQNCADSVKIVVNQASSKSDGKRTYDTLLNACRSFLKIAPPLAGIVRRDNKVRDSIRRQTGIMVRYPTSMAAGDVDMIARTNLMN